MRCHTEENARMSGFKKSTVIEQLASHLRVEILRGRWTGLMPGRSVLARELMVNHSTIQAAMELLVADGVLLAEGSGKRRRIASTAARSARRLRIGLMLYDPAAGKLDYMVDLRHGLEAAGHVVVIPPKSLMELGMNVARVASAVGKTEADAWIICGGSKEVLEWFAGQDAPAYALFGRRRQLAIAGTGPEKLPALRTSLRRMFELGHRRIVMIAREERRKPGPGEAEQAFLDELEALGMETGEYHLPDWKDNPAGLRTCLDELFKLTPPSAIIVQELPVFLATQQHLAMRGIIAPRDVSLICGDHDDLFLWFHPTIAHIRWDSDAIPGQILRWVNRLARGKNICRQTFIKADFVDGGTLGPASSAPGS